MVVSRRIGVATPAIYCAPLARRPGGANFKGQAHGHTMCMTAEASGGWLRVVVGPSFCEDPIIRFNDFMDSALSSVKRCPTKGLGRHFIHENPAPARLKESSRIASNRLHQHARLGHKLPHAPPQRRNPSADMPLVGLDKRDPLCCLRTLAWRRPCCMAILQGASEDKEQQNLRRMQMMCHGTVRTTTDNPNSPKDAKLPSHKSYRCLNLENSGTGGLLSIAFRSK